MKDQHPHTLDRKLVSDEAREMEFVHQQFLNQTRTSMHEALFATKAELKGHADRDRIIRSQWQKLC